MRKPAGKTSNVVRPDLCVIGAGPAGFSLAGAGALLGLSVVLVEGGASGADATDLAGLRASANLAHAMRTAAGFGVGLPGLDPEIHFAAIQSRLREVRDRRAAMMSRSRYTAMGVQVIEGEGRFVDANTVSAGADTIQAKRFVIAVGNRWIIPEIPGLESLPYQTPATILALHEIPRHLLVLGGGADAVSLAQTYRRLGAGVTLLSNETALLAGEDPEMVSVLERALRREGIELRLGMEIAAVEQTPDGDILARLAGEEVPLRGSCLLIAQHQVADLEGLKLEAAGIGLGPRGIAVDHHLRTGNPKVYAVDSAATDEAGIAFRNAVLRLPTRFDATLTPRLVHCWPEMASVGLSEKQARATSSRIRILRAPFSDNERAHAEGITQGHVKAITTSSGRILGCSIIGPRAHDLIVPWALAMAKGISVSDLAGAVPRGTVFSEATREAALEFVKMSAQAPWLRKALGFIRRWG